MVVEVSCGEVEVILVKREPRQICLVAFESRKLLQVWQRNLESIQGYNNLAEAVSRIYVG